MIAGLFRPRTFLEEDLEAWTFEAWAWLMRNLGGMSRIAETPVVQPNRDFFPPSDASGHERALHVFGCVKAAMGMEAWACDLEAFRRRGEEQVGEFVSLRPRKVAPLGTYETDGNRVLIRYSADLVARPGDLVATFAHELAHYLIAGCEEPWPGGEEAHELITEMTVAYAGFGGFAANAAVDFVGHGDTFSQGWRLTGGGYLSKRTWAFALAIFLALRGEGTDNVDRWIKIDVTHDTRRALVYLKRRPELLAPLRAIP